MSNTIPATLTFAIEAPRLSGLVEFACHEPAEGTTVFPTRFRGAKRKFRAVLKVNDSGRWIIEARLTTYSGREVAAWHLEGWDYSVEAFARPREFRRLRGTARLILSPHVCPTCGKTTTTAE